MKEKLQIKIQKGIDLPPPGPLGRPKGKNNYDDIVKLGVDRINNRDFNNYSAAAKALAHLAREYVWEKENGRWIQKEKQPYMSLDSLIERLARAISKKLTETKNI